MFDFDKTWTLFLDRDGVINRRLVGTYVTNPNDFEFMEGSLEAIKILSNIFGRVVVVTNQAGIGKGIMTETQLSLVHNKMLGQIRASGGRIDEAYHAPDVPNKASDMRKPGSGMAHKAKSDFPEIDFERSVMVGDSDSDIAFGNRLGMTTVFIEGKNEEKAPSVNEPNFSFESLLVFAEEIYHLTKKYSIPNL